MYAPKLTLHYLSSFASLLGTQSITVSSRADITLRAHLFWSEESNDTMLTRGLGFRHIRRTVLVKSRKRVEEWWIWDGWQIVDPIWGSPNCSYPLVSNLPWWRATISFGFSENQRDSFAIVGRLLPSILLEINGKHLWVTRIENSKLFVFKVKESCAATHTNVSALWDLTFFDMS